jgi:hypothetical protein
MVKRQYLNTTREIGRKYEIFADERISVIGQVCVGDDISVEVYAKTKPSIQLFSFRVRFQSDAPSQGHWRDIGIEPLSTELCKPAAYGYRGVGETKMWKVFFDGSPDVEIDEEAFSKIERMEAYTHDDIVCRVLRDPLLTCKNV